MNTRYISCTDTAKLIRAALKKGFPGIKFSVKSSSYAGGASVSVTWTDGPTSKAVEKIAKPFQGSTFDGMTDSKNYQYGELDGEEVQFGADSVSCSRSYTLEFVEAIVRQYCEYNGYDASKISINGNENRAYADAYDLGNSENYWFNQLLWGTDAKNMNRAYAAEEETKQQEADEYVRNEPQRRRQAQAQAERERQEEVRREQIRQEQEKCEQARQQQEQARRGSQPRSSGDLSYSEAIVLLGVGASATDEEIKRAFRAKVRYYADGYGGYDADMDRLTQAKEKALLQG